MSAPPDIPSHAGSASPAVTGRPSLWARNPILPVVLAILLSAMIGGLSFFLARPFLPPVPLTHDITEAFEAAVATVLIPGVVHALIASLGFLIVALLMAWISGRQFWRLENRPAAGPLAAQRGPIRRGLGDRALGAPGPLPGAVLAVILYAVFLSYLQFHNIDDFFGAVFRAGNGWRLAAFLVLGLLAPVAEEMMFRGWLWTSLRQSWSSFACTLVTGVIWLLTHFPEGLTKMAVLAPVALLLGFVRNRSASLRAPVLLHLALNLSSLTAPFLLRGLGLA